MPAHGRAAGCGVACHHYGACAFAFGLRRSRLTYPTRYIRINTTPPTRSMAPAILTTLTG
jgi:hypothetical protein